MSSRPVISWRVGEIRQDGAVAGEQQLARVVPAQPARVHLALEERGTALEPGPQDHRELVAQDRAALQRFPADEANEVGALLEEPERGAHDALDLRPAFAHALGRLVDERRASRRTTRGAPRGRALPWTGSGTAGWGGGCRPASAISVRLVPAYPCSANRCRATSRMCSLVVRITDSVVESSDGRAMWLRRLERRTAGTRDAAYRLVGSIVRLDALGPSRRRRRRPRW